MDFFAEIETVRERWDVLRHPFYTRWSAGELTRAELASYSGQYRHAVTALAAASASAAAASQPAMRDELARHAEEEAEHITLWDEFTRIMGGSIDAPPTPESTACAQAWADPERELLPTLVALYAIESAQPAIAATKLAGLLERYGVEEGPATEYFSLHATLDTEHAAAERALIEPLLDGADRELLLAQAECVLRANWELLDGVERLNGR